MANTFVWEIHKVHKGMWAFFPSWLMLLIAWLGKQTPIIKFTHRNIYLLIYLVRRFRCRPATIHFSTIRYISRYSCHDTIHDTIQYITTKQEGHCLMSCSWAQKSVQLTSLVLNITLNTTQHGFFSSICSENRRA